MLKSLCGGISSDKAHQHSPLLSSGQSLQWCPAAQNTCEKHTKACHAAVLTSEGSTTPAHPQPGHTFGSEDAAKHNFISGKLRGIWTALTNLLTSSETNVEDRNSHLVCLASLKQTPADYKASKFFSPIRVGPEVEFQNQGCPGWVLPVTCWIISGQVYYLLTGFPSANCRNWNLPCPNNLFKVKS